MIQSPQNIERVVFDFDSTLYDTEAKKADFYRMAEVHGYSLAEAKDIYVAAREADTKILMSLSSYIDVLRSRVRADGKVFQSGEVSRIIDRMQRGEYVLPGARALLKYCIDQYLPCYLLSLGVQEWQEEKVAQSGLGAFFPRRHIIYTDLIRGGKEQAFTVLFGPDFDGSGTALFNDKPDETADLLRRFPRLIAFVRIEPRDERYGRGDYTALENNFLDRVAVADDLPTLQRAFTAIHNPE